MLCLGLNQGEYLTIGSDVVIQLDRSKEQALCAMRALLYRMDGRDSDVKALRRQLNHMFPPVPHEEAEQNEVSNGCQAG